MAYKDSVLSDGDVGRLRFAFKHPGPGFDLNKRMQAIKIEDGEACLNVAAVSTGLEFTGLISDQVIDYLTATSVGETTDAHLIRYGTSATPIIYTPTTGGSHSGIQMHITAADAPTGLSLAAVRAYVTYTGTAKATAYGGLFWVNLNTTSYTGDYLGGTPAGVQGVIQVEGTVAAANDHAWYCGVAGEVRPLGTITKVGVISGLRAVMNCNTTAVVSGTLAGVHVGAYNGIVDTGVLVLPHVGSTFTIGLHLDSQYGTITTGITIGACTTGISISGATTNAIAISGTSSNSSIWISGAGTSGSNEASVLIAADQAGTALAYGANSTGAQCIRINATAAITGGENFHGMYSTLATSAAMADGFIIGVYSRVNLAHLAYENYAIWGRMNVNVAQTGDSGNQYLGVFGSVSFAAGAHALTATGGGYGVLGTASIASGGTLDQPLIGGYFECNAVDSIAGGTYAIRARMIGYTDYGINVFSQTANASALVYLTCEQSGKANHAIEVNATTGSGQINHLFKLEDSTSSCVNTSGNVGGAQASDAIIKIDIGGTDYYLPAFVAGNVTGNWSDLF